jgi:hypothetical protein
MALDYQDNNNNKAFTKNNNNRVVGGIFLQAPIVMVVRTTALQATTIAQLTGISLKKFYPLVLLKIITIFPLSKD